LVYVGNLSKSDFDTYMINFFGEMQFEEGYRIIKEKARELI